LPCGGPGGSAIFAASSHTACQGGWKRIALQLAEKAVHACATLSVVQPGRSAKLAGASVGTCGTGGFTPGHAGHAAQGGHDGARAVSRTGGVVQAVRTTVSRTVARRRARPCEAWFNIERDGSRCIEASIQT